MGWNPFRRKALTATPEVLSGIRNGYQPYPLLGGGNRQRIIDAFNTAQSANYAWLYQNSPAVRTVIDTLVRNVGQLDLRLYEEISEQERQPRPDHPAALSLRYPNEDTPGDQFIRQLVKSYLIFDNAYSLITPASARQLSFNWIPSQMMELRGRNLFRAEGYRYWLVDGTFADFEPDQILHWKGENPLDPRLGISKLETLRNVIAEDAALQQATVELANAGMTEPTWVFRPVEAPDWENADRERFEEDLNNRLRRRNKTPVVLEEGMEMRSFGVSPKDAEMSTIRRWAIERVAAEFGLRPANVGLEKATDEDREHLIEEVLAPLCEEMARMFNHRLLVRAYNWTDGCFEFNLDEKRMGEDAWKALVSATGRPFMLTNEGRAKVNLPPVEGGDELVTPSNVIVGEKPSVDVMPIQDPNGPSQDGDYREQPKALTKAEDRDYSPLPQLHPTYKTEHERQLRHIDAFHAVTARHFSRLERSLLERSRQKAGSADWERWDSEFGADIHEALERIIEHEGELYAFKLAGEFDTRRVKNYVAAMAEGAAEGINGKVREQIEELGLVDAVALFPQHVESAASGLGAGATRFAREEAARQSPDYEQRVKTWVPNTKRHAAFAGQTVPIGSLWPAGFAPGSAPGCKCSMTIQ